MTTPKITLDAMTEQEFAAWLPDTVRDFAQQNIKAGKWSAQDAPALAEAEFLHLLPDGVRTEDHFLSTARNAEGAVVGMLWINIRPKAHKPEAYIYEIVIDEGERGKGYGRAVMLAGIAQARELGAESVGLHVFGHNSVARELYRSLGFIETNVTMSLPLDPETATAG